MESSTRGLGRRNSRYNKSQIKCYTCQMFVLNALQCKASMNKVEEKTNYVKDKNQEEDTLLLAYKGDRRRQDHTWYLDSGASNHMCGMREICGVEIDE